MADFFRAKINNYKSLAYSLKELHISKLSEKSSSFALSSLTLYDREISFTSNKTHQVCSQTCGCLFQKSFCNDHIILRSFDTVGLFSWLRHGCINFFTGFLLVMEKKDNIVSKFCQQCLEICIVQFMTDSGIFLI